MKALPYPIALLLLALVFPLLAGCPAAYNPHAAAETPEQHAFALYGEFVIAKEAAAALVSNPTTARSVVHRIQALDLRASPIANSMRDSARTLERIRAQLAAGETPAQTLDIATANLLQWVTDLRPLLESLKAAVGD